MSGSAPEGQTRPQAAEPATRIEDLNAPAAELGTEEAEDVKGGIKFSPVSSAVKVPDDQLLLPAVRKASGDGSV